MNITFRADASTEIGTGHVMRCLALAHELRDHGADISFICREHPGNLCDFIKEKGFKVFRLQPATSKRAGSMSWNAYAGWLGVPWKQDARETKEIIKTMGHDIDWLIVDHYALDRSWEQQIRPWVGKVMVIDDLADRPHDCDVLLDQNYYHNGEERYKDLIADNVLFLLGPEYAILRPEFVEARKIIHKRYPPVKKLLVFFGGSDPNNDTVSCLNTLAEMSTRKFNLDVVVGSLNSSYRTVKDICKRESGFSFHVNINYMHNLMAQADLFLGSAGITTWERCCLGLPSIILTIAENQLSPIKALADDGYVFLLGRSCDVESFEIIKSLTMFNDDEKLMSIMSQKSMEIVDGLGCSRVSKFILELCCA